MFLPTDSKCKWYYSFITHYVNSNHVWLTALQVFETVYFLFTDPQILTSSSSFMFICLFLATLLATIPPKIQPLVLVVGGGNRLGLANGTLVILCSDVGFQ